MYSIFDLLNCELELKPAGLHCHLGVKLVSKTAGQKKKDLFHVKM